MKKIKLSGMIGYEVTPDYVRAQLDAANGEDVSIEISSPGGYVFDGLEIFNLLRNYPGNTEIHLMGLAASMASYIAMAGKKVVAEDNAVFMIHNVSAGSIGDHRDMRKTADVIESLTNLLAQKYVEKTGKTKDEIKKMMDDETYLFGDEIRAAGFSDETIKSQETPDAPARDEKVKTARALVTLCVGKMKSDEKANTDLSKAAAMIGNVNPVIEKLPEPKNEGDNMNELENFLKGNEAARAQLKAMLDAKQAEAVKVTGEAYNAKYKKIAAYLGAESAYPGPLKNLACKALTGEVEMAALDGAVALHDGMVEAEKAAAAKKESGKQPPTPPESHTGINETGAVNTEEEFQALIASKKAEKKGKE